MKSILTYSALNTFRNCPQKYRLRYVEHLRRPEAPEALGFGSVVHEALEQWYRLPADGHRLLAVLNLLDAKYAGRGADAHQKAAWHLARALVTGYAARYAREEFEVLEVEKTFEGEIRNPDTGRPSQTFTMAGKVDGLVRVGRELYLLEHKTASGLEHPLLQALPPQGVQRTATSTA